MGRISFNYTNVKIGLQSSMHFEGLALTVILYSKAILYRVMWVPTKSVGTHHIIPGSGWNGDGIAGTGNSNIRGSIIPSCKQLIDVHTNKVQYGLYNTVDILLAAGTNVNSESSGFRNLRVRGIWSQKNRRLLATLRYDAILLNQVLLVSPMSAIFSLL